MTRPARPPPRPLVIGHRGACGRLPEHTAPSFALAVEQGADAVETDLVVTRDGELVVRHDVELSATTDVADRHEFASRWTEKVIDGVPARGWFVDDFTLAEVRTLRARQRMPFRDRSHDGRYGVPTLREVLQLAADRAAAGRAVAVYLELKHPTYFESVGLPVDPPLRRVLKEFRYAGPKAPVVVESFEVTVLRRLRAAAGLPVVQLVDGPHGRPFDWTARGDPRTYGGMVSPAGLAEVATYADGVGVWKRLIVPTVGDDPDGVTASAAPRLAAPTSLVADAHAAGLFVQAWTFRDEPGFLAQDYGGDPAAEYRQFVELGIDGVITDFPEAAVAALSGHTRADSPRESGVDAGAKRERGGT